MIWGCRCKLVVVVALVTAMVLTGCTRRGPPAPVEFPSMTNYAAPRAVAPRQTLEVAAIPADGRVVVESGDTLYAISRRYGVPLRDLIDTNRLEPPYHLLIGQVLRVPQPREHIVREGESVYRISRCAGVDMSTLVRLNEIEPPHVIEPGTTLRLPASTSVAECPPSFSEVAMVPPSPSPPRRTVAVEDVPPPPPTPPRGQPVVSSPQPQDPALTPAAVSVPPPPPPPAVAAGEGFLWPVAGTVIAGFGPQPDGRHNDGINIAAEHGAEVRAAANGTVVYAGNELRGYGNLLLIRHADNWITAYAHNDALLVGHGDSVVRGQVIARVGSSGNVSRPQSHFELRRGAKSIDPIKHLRWE